MALSTLKEIGEVIKQMEKDCEVLEVIKQNIMKRKGGQPKS